MAIGWNIYDSIETVLTNIQSLWEDIWQSIFNLLSGGLIGALSQAVAIAQGIYDAFSTAASTFGSWFESAFSALGSWINQGLEAIRQGLENAYASISGGISALGNYILSGLQAIAGWFYSAFNWIGDQIYNFGNWLYNAFFYLVDALWNAISSIYQFITNLFNNIITTIKNWFATAVDTINTIWSDLARTIRSKIIDTILVNVTLIMTYKGVERLVTAKSTGDVMFSVGAMLASPILGYLAGSIVDAVLPTPTPDKTYRIVPPIELVEGVFDTYTPPALTPPSPPDKGTVYEPVEPVVSYTGDAKTMVVDTTPQRLGALGTVIKSVTVKAHLANTSAIWLSFSSDMTPDNTFVLNPGESIDIAVNDLGKLWIRAEEGTQIAYIIWVFPES